MNEWMNETTHTEHKSEANEQKQKEEKIKLKTEEQDRFQMKRTCQWHTFKMNSKDACDRYAKFNHRQQHTLAILSML